MCVGCSCGLNSWICLCLKLLGGSFDGKAANCRLRVCKMSIFVISDLLLVHKYTWAGSGCGTECVWSTCVDLIPGYVYV